MDTTHFIAVDTDMPEARELKLQLNLTDIRHMLGQQMISVPGDGDTYVLPITAVSIDTDPVVEHWTFRVLNVEGQHVSLQREVT